MIELFVDYKGQARYITTLGLQFVESILLFEPEY